MTSTSVTMYLINYWHHTGKLDMEDDKSVDTKNQGDTFYSNTRLQLMVTPEESDKKHAAQLFQVTSTGS